MAKISRCQKLLSEIELFLEAGKFEDARVLLTFLDDAPFDRESRLRLCLINATLNGIEPYREEIARISALSDLSDFEKDLIGKISSFGCDPAEEGKGRDALTPDYITAPLDPSTDFPDSKWVEDGQFRQDRQAELLALNRSVRDLERQLSEKEGLLERANARLQALGSRVTDLTEQLTSLDQANDQEVGLLHEDLARSEAISRVQESTISEQRMTLTEQIRALETQLGEAKYLLADRDAEIDSFKAKVSALMQEKVELVTEREVVHRVMNEDLREQAGLAQAMESSIVAMEKQMGEQIRLLKLQLGDTQNLLNNRNMELDELRGQVNLLNQRVAEAEAAKSQAEVLLGSERRDARLLSATGYADRPAGERAEGLQAINSGPRPARDFRVFWQRQFSRLSSIDWKDVASPATALPAVVAGLFLLPIGYLLYGQARTEISSRPPAHWEGTSASPDVWEKAELASLVGTTLVEDKSFEPGSTASPVADPKSGRVAVADRRKVSKGRAPSEGLSGYVTRRTVPLRERPRYAAKAKAEIGPGTHVTVLDTQGSWLRVQTGSSGAVGYVRKEYLVRASSIR